MTLTFAMIGIIPSSAKVFLLHGLRQAKLVLIAYASSEGSSEPAHPCSLARTFAARSEQAVSQEEPSDRKPDPWPL